MRAQPTDLDRRSFLKRTAAAFGSLLNLGLVRFARRHTFIIAPDGRIAARFNHVDPAHHAEEVRDVLLKLQRAGAARAPTPL